MKIIDEIKINDEKYGIGSLWGNIKGDISKLEDLINMPYENSDYSELKTVKLALDKILYKALSFNSFTITPYLVETGVVVDNIKCDWSYNKSIKSQSVTVNNNTENLKPDVRSYTKTGIFTLNTQIKIQAEGLSLDNILSSKTLIFQPGIYYGVSIQDVKNSEDIYTNFDRKLLINPKNEFVITTDAGEGEYIYVCIPSEFITSEVVFTHNGFNGGLHVIDGSFKFDRYGKVVNYTIYKSDYPSLGETPLTINIK